MLSEYVNANGIKIHCQRTGGDKPPIVLAHGFSDNGPCWVALAPMLREDYDVIMYDARGHGLSDAPETGYSTEDRVADLAGLIHALGLEKPILMGHSMGASTVGWTVAKHPDIASAAILEDPGLQKRTQNPLSEEERKDMAEKRRAEILERKAMTREQLMELGRSNTNWPEEEYGPWADSKLQLSPNVVSTLSGMIRGWMGDAFPKIKIPVLILKQDTDEEGKKRDQEVASLLSNGRLVHIQGAGHCIRRDKPEATIKVLKEFLAEL